MSSASTSGKPKLVKIVAPDVSHLSRPELLRHDVEHREFTLLDSFTIIPAISITVNNIKQQLLLDSTNFFVRLRAADIFSILSSVLSSRVYMRECLLKQFLFVSEFFSNGHLAFP